MLTYLTHFLLDKRRPTRLDYFLLILMQQLGKPYLWRGDDPGGFDCSGLACECLRSVGLLGDKERLSAEGLRQKFSQQVVELSQPHGGCLLFRMKDGRAEHVTILIDDHYHIGASGGDSSVDTLVEAWEKNAFVKLRPIPTPITGIHALVDPFKEASDDA